MIWSPSFSVQPFRFKAEFIENDRENFIRFSTIGLLAHIISDHLSLKAGDTTPHNTRAITIRSFPDITTDPTWTSHNDDSTNYIISLTIRLLVHIISDHLTLKVGHLQVEDPTFDPNFVSLNDDKHNYILFSTIGLLGHIIAVHPSLKVEYPQVND